ncbi:hypothetical protein GCM10011346_30120 [Oceanobacillus neutriphilus]|uniref:Uncharacterized protein n=1 Tax=Oceanobacillus neutriphilus TaxID=531815 RepID=A0ABQ2NX75_9BACI|nr:hypothetical protein GCM10011346_30120 [Oceanobacillus neutriphilus]
MSFMGKSAMIKLEKKFPLIKKINFLIKGAIIICINAAVLTGRQTQSCTRVSTKIFT